MKNKQFNHSLVLRLAIPMILSGISTPLLGLVDTAVLGHLDSELFLGAVALGGLIFSFLYWGFGFLRMATTGLTAKAFGDNDAIQMNVVLVRAVLMAVTISCFILLLQQPIAVVSFWLLQSSSEVEKLAQSYFEIRIWSAPATLCLYVLMGWLLGRQKIRILLLVVVVTNSSNIFMDLLFVYYFNMKVEGVALASVIAEYMGLLISLMFVFRIMRGQNSFVKWRFVFKANEFKTMLSINGHIFIRTWCLIFAFAFFTAQGAKMGDLVLAANAVLLNFQTFMAYALDGFAHATEALVGKAIGAKNSTLFKQVVSTATLWSLVVAIIFAMLYLFFGKTIIDLLTGMEKVRSMAYHYLPWLIIMPLVSFVCYLFDGIFIGAMLTREMRNTMLFSLLGVFLPVWYFTQSLGNHGLWLAMVIFMLARGISMTFVFYRKCLLEN